MALTIFIYNLILLSSAVCILIRAGVLNDLAPYEALRIPVLCSAISCCGGVLYCLRGMYLNICVYKRWSSDWYAWYFIRPIASIICGAISYLFLRAGLLALDATPRENASEIGFYAFAFIAGLNVDKFIAKVEEIAQATWGIEKSRSYEIKKENKDESEQDTQTNS